MKECIKIVTPSIYILGGYVIGRLAGLDIHLVPWTILTVSIFAGSFLLKQYLEE